MSDYLFAINRPQVHYLSTPRRSLLPLLNFTNSTTSARTEQPLPIQHLSASLTPPVTTATQARVEHERRDREPDGRPHECEHSPTQIATDVEVRPVLEDRAEQREQRSRDCGSSGREESCEEGGNTGNEGTGIGKASGRGEGGVSASDGESSDTDPTHQ